jgi:hypothetical protein
MFRTVPLSIIRSFFFFCTHSNGVFHTGLLRACEQDQSGSPELVEFYSKNTFEKLVRLIGFVIRTTSDVRPRLDVPA